jgi:phosphatidyl-myo-inositol dimannoside synthase
MSMRVLLATTQFAPEVGGVPRLLWQFCSHLPADVELTALSVRQQPADFYVDFDRDAPFPTLRMAPLPGSGLTSLRFALALWRVALRTGTQVILSGVAYPTAILASWVSRLTGIPYVVYAHSEDVTIKQERMRVALSAALQRAAAVITVSDFTRQHLIAMGVPTERIHLIPPGVELEKFSPPASEPTTEKRDDRFELLTVARLVFRKGQDTVIRALPRIAEAVPGVHYTIVGRGPDEPQLRALSTELGVDERVSFAGGLSDEELPAAYRSADVFIMATRLSAQASEVEGFGIVFLEANAAGKAVIAGNSGGVADAVLHEETGLLVDPLDVDAVAAAVIRLALDPSLRERLGRNGRARVERSFSAEFFAAQVLSVLRQAILTGK